VNAIILAHGGAAEAVARHTPNWQAAFDSLMFVCPSDDPLPGAFPMGLSCRNGIGAIERIAFAVALASRFEACAILEYDVLVFSQTVLFGKQNIPVEWRFGNWAACDLMGDLWMHCSEVFPNEDPEHIFAAPTYGHAPWIATGETWWKILTAGSDFQNGYTDRWLANAAKRAGVALCGMEGSYSRDCGFDASTARTARLAGAPCIHGVKTLEQYEEAMS